MKKLSLISLVLTVLISATVLCACGKDPVETGSVASNAITTLTNVTTNPESAVTTAPVTAAVITAPVEAISVVKTFEEFSSALTSDNTTISLDDDIDMSALTESFSALDKNIVGNGHKLTKLSVPLFAKISDVTVSDLSIGSSALTQSKSVCVGFLAGQANDATIKNVVIESDCKIELSIKTAEKTYTGGICGYAAQTLFESCTNNALIDVQSTNGMKYVGGIVALVNAGDQSIVAIRGCTNNGEVKLSDKGSFDSKVGGIVGSVEDATVTYCANHAKVSSADTTGQAAGIVGYVNYADIIQYCLNSGDISGSSTYIAGICGYSNGSDNEERQFLYCVNYGAVPRKQAHIVNNKNYGLISNCFWLDITGVSGVIKLAGSPSIKSSTGYSTISDIISAIDKNQAAKVCFKSEGEKIILDCSHKNVTVDRVEPTCSTYGLTEGLGCAICGKVEVSPQYIDKLPHTPGEEATCTTPQRCTTCGEIVARAKGHTYETDKVCTVCKTVKNSGDIDYSLLEVSDNKEFCYIKNDAASLTDDERKSKNLVILPEATFYTAEEGGFLEIKFKTNRVYEGIKVFVAGKNATSASNSVFEHQEIGLYKNSDNTYSGTGYISAPFGLTKGTQYVNIVYDNKNYASIPIKITPSSTIHGEYKLLFKGDWDQLGKISEEYRKSIAEFFYSTYPALHTRFGKPGEQTTVVIWISRSYTGIADCTVGVAVPRVRISASYAKKNGVGSYGSLVHELTHAVANFTGGGWFGENLANYGRFRFWHWVNGKTKTYSVSDASDWGYSKYGSCEYFWSYVDDKYGTTKDANGKTIPGLLDTMVDQMQAGKCKDKSPTDTTTELNQLVKKFTGFDCIESLRLQFAKELKEKTWTFNGYADYTDNFLTDNIPGGYPSPNYTKPKTK